MKKELNLQLDTHIDVLEEIAFKSVKGITVSEIIELQETCTQDAFEYYNKLKLIYMIPLGLLGLEYIINNGIEKILFSYIDYLIHELPVEGLDKDAKFYLS